MPRGKSLPEIFLLLHEGVTPKQLIFSGYPERTVYRYKLIYDSILKTLKKKKKAIKDAAKHS